MIRLYFRGVHGLQVSDVEALGFWGCKVLGASVSGCFGELGLGFRVGKL